VPPQLSLLPHGAGGRLEDRIGGYLGHVAPPQ
jgi:hypothetical protein